MANRSSDEQVRIPVRQEELQVGKRITDTGRGLRIHKTVSEEVWRVDDTLVTQSLDIEHVPVNAWIEGQAPASRYEGNTLVMPVVEEVLVVQKRLRLKEEIRITPRAKQEAVSERVVLRSEHVTAERFDETSAGPGASQTGGA